MESKAANQPNLNRNPIRIFRYLIVSFSSRCVITVPLLIFNCVSVFVRSFVAMSQKSSSFQFRQRMPESLRASIWLTRFKRTVLTSFTKSTKNSLWSHEFEYPNNTVKWNFAIVLRSVFFLYLRNILAIPFDEHFFLFVFEDFVLIVTSSILNANQSWVGNGSDRARSHR